MWARLVGALLGGWLVISPAVLGYSGLGAANNDHIVGPVVLCASIVAIWPVMRPLRWLGLAAGAWLLAAPWLLFRWYGSLPTINDLAVGVLLIILAFLGGKAEKSFGGGWLSLLRNEH